MTKKLISIPLLLLAFTLVACDTGDSSGTPDTSTTDSTYSSSSSDSTSSSSSDSSSTSTPSEPVELTADDVISLLEDLATTSIDGYTYIGRIYSDNYITGDIYSNSLEKIVYDVYDDGFDSEVTLYGEIENVTSLVGSDEQVGRYASYVLDDDYYIRGLQGISDADDYIEYHENNRYTDLNANAMNDFSLILENLVSIFSDPESVWSPSYGYEINDFTTTIDDDGDIVCELSCEAQEDGYYGHEIWEGHVVVSPDGEEIISLDFSSLIFDMGDTTNDPDLGANSYYFYQISDISRSEPLTDDIEPFDISTFTNVYGAPSEIVEGIEDGALSVETIQEILDNYDAYTRDTISSINDGYVSEVYDSTTWEDLGEAYLTETWNRYLDDLLIYQGTYTLADGSRDDIIEIMQYQALDVGIRFVDQYDGDIANNYIIAPEYISSLETYLSAVGFTNNLTITESFTFIVDYGFTEVTNFVTSKATLISATKEGSKIEIEYRYETSFLPYYDNTYDIKLTIEDDYLTTVTCDEVNEGTYDHYTMTKGELTEYTGTLL